MGEVEKVKKSTIPSLPISFAGHDYRARARIRGIPKRREATGDLHAEVDYEA